MKLLDNLLSTDPACPRLTMYNEATGARMDFSAQTLDNWASKVANMLVDELDLDSSSAIGIDLPVSWQAVVTVLGALTARVPIVLNDDATVVVTSLERTAQHDSFDLVVVSDDPFGRGVEETGGVLPEGAIDFGPIVRFYGDMYIGDAPALAEVVPPGKPERLLSLGWTDWESLCEAVLSPLAAGGSAVVVAGPVSTERLEQIANAEKVTARLV